MERAWAWIPRLAPLTLAVAGLVTLAALHRVVDLGTGELRLEIDASTRSLLPEGSEALEYYDFVRRLFGNDETLLVALAADDVFTAEQLARVVRLTRRIERVDGVRRVVSLANALNIRGTPDGLEVGPFVDEVPDDPAALARIRREALENPIYAGNLVTRDGTATALLVYPDLDLSDREFTEREIDRQVEAIAEQERGDARIWVTGTPYLKAATHRRLMADLARILPLTLAVLVVLLALSFRSLRGVVVPLLTIAVAVTATLAAIAWLGRALNLVTALVPPLMLTIGLAYAVHVVAEYEHVFQSAAGGIGRVQGIARGLRSVATPVALTGLTTMVGFASLALSPLTAVREFGLYFVIGVACTVVASLVLTPALLALFPPPAPRAGASARERAFDRFAGRVARFDASRRGAVFLGAAGVAGVALVGLAQLRIGTDYIGGFPRDHPARVGYEAVNRHLEGANPFYVVVRGDYSGAFEEPVNLRALQELQGWLAEQPEIGGTTSVVDYLELINRGFHENDPDHLAIPETRALASQLLWFGGNEELDGFVDSRRQIANVLVRARVIDSREMADLLSRVERRLAALPEHLAGRVTGSPVVLNRALEQLMVGQALSLFGALAVIYLILSAMFINLRIGLLALIPNALPVLAFFGALGWSGVSLGPVTSLIAPMTLGIAVDDTIHYFARYIRDARRLADERAAAISALQAVGRPVTYTTVALCVGFLTLVASESLTTAQVGVLAAFTLGFAWLTDFVLTPALCAGGLRIVTLWDALTLDLGEAPQVTIPLLRGLSTAQARIVAALMKVVEVPAGEPIARVGDSGDEMYIVIDGQLRCWIATEEGTRELELPARGDTTGEVGMFHEGRRSANVEALTDARLLRLTPDNLARLDRRYPRIAVRVHHNLNRILAGRLARLTDRL